MSGWKSIEDVLSETECQKIEEWAEEIRRQKLDYQFERFAKYLLSGTLRPLANIKIKLPQAA
jgi:hypothetical protein